MPAPKKKPAVVSGGQTVQQKGHVLSPNTSGGARIPPRAVTFAARKVDPGNMGAHLPEPFRWRDLLAAIESPDDLGPMPEVKTKAEADKVKRRRSRSVCRPCRDRTRNSANVEKLGFLAVDVDGGASFDDVVTRLREAGVRFVAHTTASHGAPWAVGDCFRVIVPVRDAEADPSLVALATAGLAGKVLGLSRDDMDAATSLDAARLYYLPATFDELREGYRSEHGKGEPADAEALAEWAQDHGLADSASGAGSGVDGVRAMNARKVPGFSLRDLRKTLRCLPEQWGAAGEGTWHKVAAAVHLQFDGSEEAYEVLDEWSAKRSGYSAEGNRKRWDAGFTHSGDKAWTVGRLMQLAESNGWKRPERLRLDRTRKAPDPETGDDSDDSDATRVVTLTFGREVKESAMDFVMEPFAPRGLVVGTYGGAGVGKSSLWGSIAAAASSGKGPPGLPIDPNPDARGSTLWCSSEEGKDWVIARHLKQGGVPETIVVPDIEVTEKTADGKAKRTTFDAVRDLPRALRKANAELKAKGLPPVRLVVLDAVVALVHWNPHSGGPNSDQAVKEVLAKLNHIAATWDVCIVLIGHRNKDHKASSKADRVAGSASWVSSPRLALYVDFAGSESQHERRIVQSLQTRIGEDFATSYGLRVVHVLQRSKLMTRADGTPVARTLQGVDQFARFAWGRQEIALLLETFAPIEGGQDQSASEGHATRDTKRARVREWVSDRLRKTSEVRRADIPADLQLGSGLEWQAFEREAVRDGLFDVSRDGRAVVYEWTADRMLQ